MAIYERDVAVADSDLAVRSAWWDLSWKAVCFGTIAALGLFTLLMLFGTALGLSIADPYMITRNENHYAWPAATIAWFVVSSLAAAFVGAWFAGYLSRVDRDSSLLEGTMVWGLSMLLVAFAFGRMFQVSPRDATPAGATTRPMVALSYSSLDDPAFTDYVLQRARGWTPGTAEEPINVSADNRDRVNPDKVSDNSDLRKFVRINTNLSDKQAEDFLESDKNAIANAQAESQKKWERDHAMDLSRADRARKTASAAAWTLTAVAFFTLAASLGGAWFGYFSRERWARNNADYNRAARPLEPQPATVPTDVRRDIPPM